jgi:hypothetical protein
MEKWKEKCKEEWMEERMEPYKEVKGSKVRKRSYKNTIVSLQNCVTVRTLHTGIC